jgi:hypothetical protein
MAPLPTKARGRRTGSLRPYGQLQRCRRRRFGLPDRLIVHFFAILCGANLKYGSLKSLSKNQGSDQEDEGGAGVLQQGHRGEGLQELEAQDLGCC